MSIQSLAWQAACCGGFQYIEHQTRAGEWLRIIKPFVGGYKVTVFGTDKMLKEAERQVSEDELAAML